MRDPQFRGERTIVNAPDPGRALETSYENASPRIRVSVWYTPRAGSPARGAAPLFGVVSDAAGQAERFQPLRRAAEAAGVPVQVVTKQDLFRFCDSKQHQGVALHVSPFPYTPLDDSIFERRRLLLLDNIEDPRNAGAILRSADIFGFSTVLMPLRGGTDLYPSVVKTSAGASEHLDIVRAANSTRYVKRAKESGYRVVALDMQGTVELSAIPVKDSRPLLLVIGGEDKRIGQFILNEADVLARIPQRGHVNSLNASVAAGIALCHFAEAD